MTSALRMPVNPPEARPFELATPREVRMTDEQPIPQPDLSQQQNPKAQAQAAAETQARQPVSPDQVRQGQSGGGNLQRILSYFESQGASPDQVVATIGGISLKLSDLKSASGSREQAQPSPPAPQSDEPVHEDEFKP